MSDYFAAFLLGAAPMGLKDESTGIATVKRETDGKDH
jgi:hypothetical protein